MGSPPTTKGSSTATRWTILKTRVGRRVFLLFIGSALIPVLGLAVVSYRNVGEHLRTLSTERAQANAKAAGMALIERLLASEGQLRDFAEREGEGGTPGRFLEHALFTPLSPGDPSPAAVGGLAVDGGTNRAPTFSLTVSTDRGEAEARLRVDSLLAPARLYADSRFGEGVCLLAHDGGLLECDPSARSVVEVFASQVTLARRGTWIGGPKGAESLLGYWTVHLPSSFRADPLVMVVVESTESLTLPAETFRAGFLLAIALCMGVVVTFSTALIRRNLKPLDQLREAAEGVGRQDFGTRVTIRSGDEFEDLGHTFNAMVDRLESQLGFIESLREIDHAGLTATGVEEVIVDSLGALVSASDVHEAGVLVPHPPEELSGVLHRHRYGVDLPPIEVPVPADQRTWLEARLDAWDVDPNHLPAWLGPSEGCDAIVALPIRSQNKLTAVAVLMRRDHWTSESRGRARQVVNQMALGLSRVQLVESLNDFNVSTIRAFARTIDATSPWTKGHSERVAHLSVAISRAMDLSESDQELIFKGGLLHDIGKIGVPKDILDKAGPLTDDEFDAMKAHPVVGVRILEPIREFDSLVPMVRSHHERLDGTGYPDGLTGYAIHPWARILAVADVWDAITSARPYRAGLPYEKALSIIVSGSGSHFDPRVVSAFTLIARDWYPDGGRAVEEANPSQDSSTFPSIKV